MKIKMRVAGQPVKMTVTEATIVHGGGSAPPYTGPYTVTPKVEAQTLETAQKLMTDDVSVKAIPYYEMDNKEGTTVFIGSEV